jgi:hypothetical protein
VDSAKVLVQVLLASEACPGGSFAIGKGAELRFLLTTVKLVNFSFVPYQATTIGEALKFLTPEAVALVWSLVFIHVLAPFTLPVECHAFTLGHVTYYLAHGIARRLFIALERLRRFSFLLRL